MEPDRIAFLLSKILNELRNFHSYCRKRDSRMLAQHNQEVEEQKQLRQEQQSIQQKAMLAMGSPDVPPSVENLAELCRLRDQLQTQHDMIHGQIQKLEESGDESALFMAKGIRAQIPALGLDQRLETINESISKMQAELEKGRVEA